MRCTTCNRPISRIQTLFRVAVSCEHCGANYAVENSGRLTPWLGGVAAATLLIGGGVLADQVGFDVETLTHPGFLAVASVILALGSAYLPRRLVPEDEGGSTIIRRQRRQRLGSCLYVASAVCLLQSTDDGSGVWTIVGMALIFAAVAAFWWAEPERL